MKVINALFYLFAQKKISQEAIQLLENVLNDAISYLRIQYTVHGIFYF